MGIPGLTTYINSRKDIYFDKFKLSNTVLIIDVNSLSCNIYQKYLSGTAQFGGDYDKLGFLIENLFKTFKSCNIIPIVVFDGGCQTQKLKTICLRQAERVSKLENLTPGQLDNFPLMMRYTFKEKIRSLGIPVLQSDVEADREIAALSKMLYNAPVLSNDSDFYIFDVPYIPLNMFNLDFIQSPTSLEYIPCYIFNKSKFLNRFLDKNILPFFATILGNDYINTMSFKSFFDQIKLNHIPKMSMNQKRIQRLLEWMENKSCEAVMDEVLTCFEPAQRKRQKRKIAKSIKGYTDMDTILANYIPETFKKQIEDLNKKSCKDTSVEEHKTDCSKLVSGSDEKEIGSEDDDNIPEDCTLPPSWLLERSRKGELTPNILTLLTLKTYFASPQPENYNLPSSDTIGISLVQFIGGVILGEATLKYWSRQKRNKYECSNISTIVSGLECYPMPLVENLLKLPLDERKKIILDKFLIKDMNKFLEIFPEDLILFIVGFIFWVKSSATGPVKPVFVHAVIMMLIAINTIDTKVEFYRKRDTFLKKYQSEIQSLKNVTRSPVEKQEMMSVDEARAKITREDCLVLVESFLPYFSADNFGGARNYESKHFSINTVHTFIEFQVCLDIAITLNSVFGSPFKMIDLTKLYSSTFLHNMSSDFRSQKNAWDYIEKFFSQSPTILNLYLTIYQALRNFIP